MLIIATVYVRSDTAFVTKDWRINLLKKRTQVLETYSAISMMWNGFWKSSKKKKSERKENINTNASEMVLVEMVTVSF